MVPERDAPEIPPRTHALLASLVTAIFDELGIAISVYDERSWQSLHVAPSAIRFELEHGVEHERYAYNERSIAEVKRKHATVVGTHGGYTDLFVPVGSSEPVTRLLVVGPLATTDPTSDEIRMRWRWLTGKHGHITDPEFADYVSATLAAPVLRSPELLLVQTLAESLAELLASEGDAEDVARRGFGARNELADVTFTTRMWNATREMVDERTEHFWQSLANRIQIEELGAERAPGHALVGLVSSRSSSGDDLDEVLRRYAFQRASVELARELGNVLAGRVGDHGVFFLLSPERSNRTARGRLLRVGTRAQKLATRFDLSLHLGLGATARATSLSARYRAALGAAERALSTGSSAEDPSASDERPLGVLRELRGRLGRPLEQRPADLAARFERYLEAVARHAGYRPEAARPHLEVGFERLTEPLTESGALDARSATELYAALELASERATTLSDLFVAYRRAVADIERALSDEGAAQRERSLRRAVEFVNEHSTEPLTLAAVARVAGFAKNYFAELFRAREGVTFGRYVRNLRVEHAERLLDRTHLDVARVGQLAGFPSKHHFHRVFKAVVGATPAQYRRKPVRVASRRRS